MNTHIILFQTLSMPVSRDRTSAEAESESVESSQSGNGSSMGVEFAGWLSGMG